MKLDEYDFDKTARAVYIMNESAPTLFGSEQELKDFMVSMAYAYSHSNNSFSTGGFVLTAYDGIDGERCVRASVSSYVANLYIDKMEKSYG